MDDLAWLTARPIAHRGLHDGNGTCWENTLPAFAGAIRCGYAVECDVRLSRDGIAMVFHDARLDRLTERPGFLRDHDATDLAAMRVGSTQVRIPTLRQVLERVNGATPLLIELKGEADHDEGLVAAVARELISYSGHAAIMSFDHHLIRRFSQQAPEIPAGLTAQGTARQDLEAHFSMLAHEPAFISYNHADLPNLFVDLVRQRLGLPVICWTVRDANAAATARLHSDQITFEGFLP